MGNSQQSMPKVEFKNDEKLKSAYAYSKHLEAKNFERSILARKELRKKRVLFTGSVILVLSIYTFTIVKIKQELFLDDFEEPPRQLKEDN